MTCETEDTCTQVGPFFAGFDSHPGTNSDNIKDKEEYDGDGLVTACWGQILDLVPPKQTD